LYNDLRTAEKSRMGATTDLSLESRFVVGFAKFGNYGMSMLDLSRMQALSGAQK
jgi:hypothetical protein